MMNNILLLISCLAIISCAGEEIHNELEPFHVTIFDSDYSMALTGKYELTDSSMTITRIGGLVGESDSVLYARDLTTKEKKTVGDFITIFPLSSLEHLYENPDIIIVDGDQKLFVFEIGDIKKEIQISNYYQSDLSSLVHLFNDMIPEQFQIRYVNDR